MVAKQAWKERALATEKELVDIYKLATRAYEECEITPSTKCAPRLACELCCDLVFQVYRRLEALEAADIIRPYAWHHEGG